MANEENKPIGLAQQGKPAPRLITGEVYFVTDEQAIKIGYSGAPTVRLKDIQTSHHAQLRIMGSIPASEWDEQRLHDRFAHLRIRGEWFRPEIELMAFIYKVCPLAQRPLSCLQVPTEDFRWGPNGDGDVWEQRWVGGPELEVWHPVPE